MKNLVFLLLFSPSLALAAVDRTEMVAALVHAMPVLLKFTSTHPKIAQMPGPEKAAFRAATKTFEAGIEIDFNQNGSEFYSLEGETQRLMRTGPEQTDPIHVNLEVLNAEQSEITIPVLAEILFHEAARKNIQIPLETFDRAARIFSSVIESYTKQEEIAPHHLLHMLSIPAASLHKNLVETANDEFQPTYLLFWQKPYAVKNLTPLLDQKIRGLLPSVRGFWAELMQPFLLQFNAVVRGAMAKLKELMQQFGRAFDINGFSLEAFSEMASKLNFDFEEVRRFDMQGVSVLLADQNAALVSLRSQMHISRADEVALPFELQGMSDLNNFDAPVTVQLALPFQESESPEIYAMTRTQIGDDKEVKVRSVMRSGEWPSQIKVRFNSPKTPRFVQLSVEYPSGSLALPATSTEPDGKGHVDAVFEIPPSLQNASVPLTATAILINYKTAHYLDRTIEIKDGPVHVSQASPENSVVEGKAGYWGHIEDQTAFLTDFSRQHGFTAFIDVTVAEVREIKAKEPTDPQSLLSPTKMHMQFELAHPENNIRAVRMTFMRQFTIAHKIVDNEFFYKEVEGEVLRWTFHADGAETKTFYEDVTLSGDQIKWDEDQKTGHVFFQLPFEKLRVLKVGEGYMPPNGSPIGIEIITQDFRSIHYQFPKRPIDPCETNLNFNAEAGFEVDGTAFRYKN